MKSVRESDKQTQFVRTTGDWEMVKEDTVRDQTEGWGRKSFSLVTFDEDDDDFDDADQERGGVIWGQWGGFFLQEGAVRIWGHCGYRSIKH